jgi:hypothetical protein
MIRHFRVLNDFAVSSGEDIPIHLRDTIKEHLKRLKSNFRVCFPDLDPRMEWVRNAFAPCDATCNLSSNEKHSLIDLGWNDIMNN